MLAFLCAGCWIFADKVREKAEQLMEDGVYTVAEMKRHLFHYVRAGVFSGQDFPPSTNRRYFPSSQTLRNLFYKIRHQKVQSKVDQINLRTAITGWKDRMPDDLFFFREYMPTVQTEYNVNDDDYADVQLTSQASAGLLFCYQSKWQQHLLMRYGHEICLLDVTYKTSRYAMPLFYLRKDQLRLHCGGHVHYPI